MERLEYKPVKEFRAGDIIVQVRCAYAAPRDRYSFQIGCASREGTFRPFFPVFVRAKNGRVDFNVTDIEHLKAVIHDAEKWIGEQCQKQEDALLDSKRHREEAAANRDKPRLKPGIGTLGKMDGAARAMRTAANPGTPSTGTPSKDGG